MNGSNFQIEQQCPQCGAPIILDETDRILSCKFCRTRVYLATDDHFRFYIPPKEGISENIYFIPYWRIRGLSYAIKALDIAFKYFDASFLSFDSPVLPYSLGLRPQAMRLRFVGNRDHEGKFIKSSHRAKENLLENYRTQSGAIKEIFIGETASVIYTPIYLAKGHVYDAILKEQLDLKQKDAEMEQALLTASDEKWHVEFVPLLCPHCGADLNGEKDALIVFCHNCNSAWNPSGKNFSRVNFLTWPEKEKNVIYLPFWQMNVKVAGIQLESYADLIKIANLPKALTETWKRTPFYFQIPAFKVNPALFLRWCRQLTAQPVQKDLSTEFPSTRVYPATLPVTEAVESALIALTSLMADKRRLQEIIPSLKFTLEDYSLVFHPFAMSTKGELTHTKLGFTIDKVALNLGIYL